MRKPSSIPWRWLCLLACWAMCTLAMASASVPEAEVARPVRSCASLTAVDLVSVGGAGSQVTSATLGTLEGAPACEVTGRLAPDIGFKVVLPTQTWTQRYLQVGCGGLCGRIGMEVGAADGCVPLTQGRFAIATTDMGHEGDGGDFGADPQKRIDFAHRGVHLTAVAAKRLIAVFYGRAQRYAYFTGCSDGGREALVEAQRYPEDFNGIIAGAAALNFQAQNGVYHAWLARANTSVDGKAIVLSNRLPLIHHAVLEQCDALDGEKDGLISDPLACHFDPAGLACHAGETPNRCLTPAEVEAVRRFYTGPRDPETGKPLLVGSVQPGSELGWAGVFVPAEANQPIFSEKIALDALRGVSYAQNPPVDFNLPQVRFDKAGFDLLRPLHSLYDATNPNLDAFAAAGGKLILWHGWADPHISPLNTLAYHQALRATLGEARTRGFERLYLLPGVNHCGGGEGPSSIDLLTPMLAWVEQAQAPGAITATGARGSVSSFGAPMGGSPPGGAGPEDRGPPPRSFGPGAPGAGQMVGGPPGPGRGPADGRRKATALPSRQILPYEGTPALPDWLGADFFQPR